MTTLDNTDYRSTVAYSICQGWLDILICGKCCDQSGVTLKMEGKDAKIFSNLTLEDVSKLLNHTAIYLVKNLNQGTFEGAAGAKVDVMLRLSLVYDMLLVVNNAHQPDSKGETLALKALFSSVQPNSHQDSQKLLDELKNSLTNLLLWLFLNGRIETDSNPHLQLYNQQISQPATDRVKRITTNILSLFELVSDCPENDVAIKTGLEALMRIVRQVNSNLVTQSECEHIGFNTAITLSEKTNLWFTQLLSQWLVSDKIVNYFVFELKGFAFLLDTIATDKAKEVNSEPVSVMIDTSSTPVKEEKQITVAETDLLDLSDLPSLKSTEKQEVKKAPAKLEEKKDEEDYFGVNLQEFGKTMKLEHCSREGLNVKNFEKVDWPVNKKVYKHKLLNMPFNNEITLLFKLSQPTLLREIQIGFINYWPADQDFYVAPLSVVLLAGPSKDDLRHVFTLDECKDAAFQSVQATVFGKQLQAYENSIASVENVENIIKQKLQSIKNVKVEYIEFRMRRSVMTCLENSPLVTKI